MPLLYIDAEAELQYFGHLMGCKEPTKWKRPWCWERLKAKGEGDGRGWDGWMASPTQWTRVWANSRRQWRTEKPGVLQFVGLQRVGQYLEAEQQPPPSPVLVGGQLLGWVSIIQLKIDTTYWGSTRSHRLRVQSYQTVPLANHMLLVGFRCQSQAHKLICYYRSEVPMTLSLGSINLPEWLTQFRETLSYVIVLL